MTINTGTVLPAHSVSWRSTLFAAGIAASGSVVVNGVIAWAAREPLGAPSEFQPLTPGVFGVFTILGALFGAIGWRLIVAKSANPARVLRALVPTVVALSLIPDVVLLVSRSMPGVTTTGVVALMLMHMTVAAIGVVAYRRFMPLR